MELTKKYIESELKRIEEELPIADKTIGEQRKDIFLCQKSLKARKKRNKNLRKIIGGSLGLLICAIEIALSLSVNQETILASKLMKGLCATIIVVASLDVLNGIKNFFKQNRIFKESKYWMPGSFKKVDGELVAKVLVKQKETAVTRLEERRRDLLKYQGTLNKIYEKIGEDEKNILDKEIKDKEMADKLMAEWDAYLEEISKINPSKINFECESALDIEPVKLKKII